MTEVWSQTAIWLALIATRLSIWLEVAGAMPLAVDDAPSKLRSGTGAIVLAFLADAEPKPLRVRSSTGRPPP